MSWLQKLYETYEACQSHIGSSSDEVPLLPICHTTQKAHITIFLNEEAEFQRAKLIPKSESRTIIPATEDSAGRTSGTTPHPLCDKLEYVAGDYLNFVEVIEKKNKKDEKKPKTEKGTKATSQNDEKKKTPHEDYKDLLANWADFDKENEQLQILKRYIEKGKAIQDLIEAGVLYCEENGKLRNTRMATKQSPDEGKQSLKSPSKKKKNAKEDKFDIFNLLGGGYTPKGESKPWQADAFIRWDIAITGNPQSAVWSDQNLWDSWQRYYASTNRNTELCFVTGERQSLANNQPAKIRNDGDKAKLISSNDKSGFTFRGRFITADEVAGIGFVTSQKSHNALRWLIARQGFRYDEQAIVAWAVSGTKIPDPFRDSLSLMGDNEQASEQTIYTAESFAKRLNKLMAGYKADLGSAANIVVMAVDAATPGRLAITFYRELDGSEFLSRIEDWHSNAAWWQKYFNKEKKKWDDFVGAASPQAIAETAYGLPKNDDKSKKKLIKNAIERLIPCIIDAQPIPRDMVESAVRRVSNRLGMEWWEWERALGVACSMFKILHKERRYEMALEKDRTSRDYLYGRLLAVADRLEKDAQYRAGEQRETNAARLMQRFAERPYSTWRTIELSLNPYKARLRGAVYLTKIIDEIMATFIAEEFTDDRKLSGEFLLGYHCQSKDIPYGKSKSEATDSNNEQPESNVSK